MNRLYSILVLNLVVKKWRTGRRRSQDKTLGSEEGWVVGSRVDFHRREEELVAHYLNHPQEKAVSGSGTTPSRRISKSNVTIKLSPRQTRPGS